MLFDKGKISQTDTEKSSLSMSSKDIPNISMTGQIIDRIYKNGKLVEVIEGHNLVVNSFVNLVMCLLKRNPAYSGIQYWAVGSGATTWDSALPSPEPTATRLTNEIGRVAIDPNEIVFLDSNFNEVSTPTNIIQISHIFDTADCNGVWREFGIFGGNATSSLNSGIMINKRLNGISLFASAGIGETYFKDAGIDIMVSNELLERRAELYKAISPETTVVCGDKIGRAHV